LQADNREIDYNDKNEINCDELQEIFKAIIIKNIKSKNILDILKLLVDIIDKDSHSQVKDLSIDILLILRNILELEEDYDVLEKFEEIISYLPHFRVKIIKTGKFYKNKNETNQNFLLKEYKANLDRIKSSINLGFKNKSPNKSTRINKRNSASKERRIKNKFRSNVDDKFTNNYSETKTSLINKHRENNKIEKAEKDNDVYAYKRNHNKYGSHIDDNDNVNDNCSVKGFESIIFFGKNKQKIIKDRNNYDEHIGIKSIDKDQPKNHGSDKNVTKINDSDDDQAYINKYKNMNSKEKENRLKKDSKGMNNIYLYLNKQVFKKHKIFLIII
jgi:hypothetical protein